MRGFERLCSFLHGCGARVTLLANGLLVAKHADDVESNPICRRCVCSLNYKGNET